MDGIKERLQRLVQFLMEVKTELRKVTWPSRRDTLASTSVVLVIIILVTIYLGLIDLGLAKIIKYVLR